ncbi:two-component system response regulator [Marinobacterium aestuarii]|uniref:Two-component system response regulator n=1 Tax=Marinobacterium aestuarii TaxID=1821621 RepID=A0A1A9F019_9GAMM|nr:response regulator [Marinobacterium aestuarii]ANG63487.1 two-component system response regulator [Marinobacterium aestuarii]
MNQNPILLVEDNPDDEALALRAFKKSDIRNEVVVVRDGVEALEYLFPSDQPQGRTADSLPAVVLLDLKLPRIDGLEVLRRIRRHDTTKLMPVVILTSSREEQDMISAYQLGANSYVRKPVDFNEFAQAVSHLGTYWLRLNELP